MKAIIQVIAMTLLLTNSADSAVASSLNPVYEQFLSNNAIPLEALHNLSSTSKLDGLDKTFMQSRVVFLGEPDHYITEKLEYQFAMIKRLFMKDGFTAVGVEMGRSDAARINAYIQTGNEQVLDSVALFGNLSQIRVRRDLPKGLLAGKTSLEGKQASEQTKQASKIFWKKIRELNVQRTAGSKPLSVFGFDVDVYVGGAYVDLDNRLKSVTGPAVQKLRFLIYNAKTERRKTEIRNLKNALEFAIKNRRHLSLTLQEKEYRQIISVLRQLIESFEFIDVAFENPTNEQWLEIVAKREKTMMWQMDEQLRGSDKIVLIGHNDHLAQNSKVTSLGDSSAPFAATWYKIGTYLKEKLGKQVYGIWMLYGGGARSWGPECPTAWCSIHIRPNTINADLAELASGKPFLFVFPEFQSVPDEMKRVRDYQFNGKVINSTKIRDQADAILFVPVVRPTGPF